MQILFITLICFIATTMGAISGIGGGVIIKPLMDAVSGLPISTINFLSGCAVLAMSLVSLLRSRKGSHMAGAPAKRRIVRLALGAAVGGVAGKELFDIVRAAVAQARTIVILQNGIMVVLVIGVFFYMLFRPRIRTHNVHSGVADVAIGLLLGVFSAFLGIGGGPINLVVLYYFYSMDTKEASFNSIFIICFSQLASLLVTLLKGTVPPFDPPLLFCMVAGGVAGGFLGRTLSRHMSHAQVDRVFRALLIAITAISIWNMLRACTNPQ